MLGWELSAALGEKLQVLVPRTVCLLYISSFVTPHASCCLHSAASHSEVWCMSRLRFSRKQEKGGYLHLEPLVTFLSHTSNSVKLLSIIKLYPFQLRPSHLIWKLRDVLKGLVYKTALESWWGGSEVKSTCYFYERPGFSS